MINLIGRFCTEGSRRKESKAQSQVDETSNADVKVIDLREDSYGASKSDMAWRHEIESTHSGKS